MFGSPIRMLAAGRSFALSTQVLGPFPGLGLYTLIQNVQALRGSCGLGGVGRVTPKGYRAGERCSRSSVFQSGKRVSKSETGIVSSSLPVTLITSSPSKTPPRNKKNNPEKQNMETSNKEQQAKMQPMKHGLGMPPHMVVFFLASL